MARTRAKEAAEGANGIQKGARKEAEKGMCRRRKRVEAEE
jgi:hypothetical protein